MKKSLAVTNTAKLEANFVGPVPHRALCAPGGAPGLQSWQSFNNVGLMIKVSFIAIRIIVLLTIITGYALAQPYEVVAFGDSTTAPRNVGADMNGRPVGDSSYGANDSANTVSIVDESSPYLYVYADQIRDALPDYLTNDTINVYNEGIGGNRTDEGLARLSTDVQSKNPDLVIIQFGINDSAHDNGPGYILTRGS